MKTDEKTSAPIVGAAIPEGTDGLKGRPELDLADPYRPGGHPHHGSNVALTARGRAKRQASASRLIPPNSHNRTTGCQT